MTKVYVVYYDNGLDYEDHDVYVDRIYASKESADKYAEEKNVPIQHFSCSMTEEEYNKQDPSDIHYSYEEFCQLEQMDWMMFSQAKYYVSEQELYS